VITVAKTPEATPEFLRRLTADAVIRLALFDLRVVPAPTSTDYAAAAALLGIAQAYAPTDEELLRRRADAAWGAGDSDLLMEITQRMVQLDPQYTVAQLRLISKRLAAFQTTDERLTRMEQLLGVKGQSLDASIRSRLALDAALLYREKGDEANFIAKLKQSTQLDSTNKDAALLAFNFYNSRVSDVMGKLELMANLLYADPIDPNVLMMLSNELASAGAFNQARRFHKVGLEIRRLAGADFSPRNTIGSIMLDWHCEGVRNPFEYIKKQLSAQRNIAARDARERKADQGELAQNLKPEEVRLDFFFEQVRLATSATLDDQTSLAESIKDFAATVEGRAEVLAAPKARGPGWTDESAAEETRFARQELNLWRLIINRDVDKAISTLDLTIADVPDTNARKRAIETWVAVRAGDVAKALEIADRPGDADLHAALARAAALEAAGKKTEAAAALLEISAESPTSIIGTYAYDLSAKVLGQSPRIGDADTPLARSTGEYAAQIPSWIDTIISQPKFIQTMTVVTPPQRVGPLDRTTLTVTLRNISPIPLALGSDKPINTRFLFNPMIELGSSERDAVGEPEVYEFDRRFRLMPNEEMSVTVWPEAGITGYLTQNGSRGPTRLRWRVLQGFEATASAKDRGPGCLEYTTPTTAREALLESQIPMDQLVERLNAASDATIAALLVGARASLQNADSESFADSGKGSLIQALVAQYPTWSVPARTLCAAMMPPQSQLADLKPLDDVIKADSDPAIRLIAVLTRVASPEDPLLAAVDSGADATLIKAAALQRERLAQPAPTYAKVGASDLLKQKSAPAVPLPRR